MTDRIQPISIISILVLAAFITAGCGNKGELYMPDAEAVMQQPENQGKGSVESGPQSVIPDAAPTEN